MKTRLVQIARIKLDESQQVRAALSEEAIERYSEALVASIKLPPVDLLPDGDRYWVLDGFHRITAAKRLGCRQIRANLRELERDDALKFALGANSAHGLPRSNVDKRHSVSIALRAWPHYCDSEIARICAVSQPFVGTVRKEVLPGTGEAPRLGGDGKLRRLPVPSRPAAHNPKPQHVSRRDSTGMDLIPPLLPLWDSAAELGRSFADLSKAVRIVEDAQEQSDILFAEVNVQSALADLHNLIANLRRLEPYAVCPTCAGQETRKDCGMCRGRGFVSKFFWDQCIPEEVKRLREKAAEVTR